MIERHNPLPDAITSPISPLESNPGDGLTVLPCEVSWDATDIASSSALMVALKREDLLENSDVESADAAANENLLVAIFGLEDLDEVAAEDEAAGGFEDSEEKTEPNTRLALARVARFLFSCSNLRSTSYLLGGVRRPSARNNRVIRTECRLGRRGRQGGSGSRGNAFS